MIMLIDFILKLHNLRDQNPSNRIETVTAAAFALFLFKRTQTLPRSVGFSELTGFMCGLSEHIHPVRPLTAVGFGPVLASESVIQPVGCEKARGQCCHGDGDSTR